jgi:hypothetical protein
MIRFPAGLTGICKKKRVPCWIFDRRIPQKKPPAAEPDLQRRLPIG